MESDQKYTDNKKELDSLSNRLKRKTNKPARYCEPGQIVKKSKVKSSVLDNPMTLPGTIEMPLTEEVKSNTYMMDHPVLEEELPQIDSVPISLQIEMPLTEEVLDHPVLDNPMMDHPVLEEELPRIDSAPISREAPISSSTEATKPSFADTSWNN